MSSQTHLPKAFVDLMKNECSFDLSHFCVGPCLRSQSQHPRGWSFTSQAGAEECCHVAMVVVGWTVWTREMRCCKGHLPSFRAAFQLWLSAPCLSVPLSHPLPWPPHWALGISALSELWLAPVPQHWPAPPPPGGCAGGEGTLSSPHPAPAQHPALLLSDKKDQLVTVGRWLFQLKICLPTHKTVVGLVNNINWTDLAMFKFLDNQNCNSTAMQRHFLRSFSYRCLTHLCQTAQDWTTFCFSLDLCPSSSLSQKLRSLLFICSPEW